jgi:choice-of-anchor C domain-containing protein
MMRRVPSVSLVLALTVGLGLAASHSEVAFASPRLVARPWSAGDVERTRLNIRAWNGDFEEPRLDTPFESFGGHVGNWVVTGGGVDLVTTEFIAAAHGRQSIDLNAGTAGGLERSLALPGGEYRLMFELAGNPDTFCGPQGVKQTVIKIDGATVARISFDTTGHTMQEPGWIRHSVIFTATMSSTAISFRSDTPGTCAGPMIDHIVLMREAN